MNALVLIALLWLVPFCLCLELGRSKGRPEAYAYGIMLGWVGVLVLALLPARGPGRGRRECPHCKEGMRADAAVCPHCRHTSGGEVPA